MEGGFTMILFIVWCLMRMLLQEDKIVQESLLLEVKELTA